MKPLVILLCIFFSYLNCIGEIRTKTPLIDDLEVRNKLVKGAVELELHFKDDNSPPIFYEPFARDPFMGTGWAYVLNSEGGLWRLWQVVKGKPHGWDFMFHYSGNKSSEKYWIEGKREGLSINWHDNGQKERELIWRNDKRIGTGIEWYENGLKKAEYHFKNGKEEGIQKYWYENGQKSHEDNFKNGKLHGSSTWWYKGGAIKAEIKAENGRWLSVDVWQPNGDKCTETKLVDGDGVFVDYEENGAEKRRAYIENYKFKD